LVGSKTFLVEVIENLNSLHSKELGQDVLRYSNTS